MNEFKVIEEGYNFIFDWSEDSFSYDDLFAQFADIRHWVRDNFDGEKRVYDIHVNVMILNDRFGDTNSLDMTNFKAQNEIRFRYAEDAVAFKLGYL